MILGVVGTLVTAFGLHVLGFSSAEGSPFGFGFVVGGSAVLLGGTVLALAARRAARELRPVLVPATATGVVCLLALTAGLLGLPADDSAVGPECLTSSGALVDCDDPRIDTDAERGTARPRGGPAPEPGPAARPAG